MKHRHFSLTFVYLTTIFSFLSSVSNPCLLFLDFSFIFFFVNIGFYPLVYIFIFFKLLCFFFISMTAAAGTFFASFFFFLFLILKCSSILLPFWISFYFFLNLL